MPLAGTVPLDLWGVVVVGAGLAEVEVSQMWRMKWMGWFRFLSLL